MRKEENIKQTCKQEKNLTLFGGKKSSEDQDRGGPGFTGLPKKKKGGRTLVFQTAWTGGPYDRETATKERNSSWGKKRGTGQAKYQGLDTLGSSLTQRRERGGKKSPRDNLFQKITHPEETAGRNEIERKHILNKKKKVDCFRERSFENQEKETIRLRRQMPEGKPSKGEKERVWLRKKRAAERPETEKKTGGPILEALRRGRSGWL